MRIRKTVLPLLLFISLLFLLFFRSIYSSYPSISGSTFALTFYSGESLGFYDDKSLVFDVKSGIWNGSSGYISVYSDGGTFRFYAQNNSVLEVSSPDAPSGMQLSVSGASYSKSSEFVWLVTITSGNTVTFVWDWRTASWLDVYFLFGIGLTGIGLMCFAPVWAIFAIRKNAFHEDTMERIGICVILFAIGFGLFITWLWS